MSEDKDPEVEVIEDESDDEVQGHAVRKAGDDPDNADEPDVEGHALRKRVQK